MKGLGRALVRGRDILSTYDPARSSLRSACRVMLAVVLALLCITLLGRLTHHPLMSLALAVVLAMNTSMAVRDPSPAARRVTTLLAPLPAALAVTLATLLSGLPLGGEAGFVLVACAAVYVRRFGSRGFALGLVGFMSYFFALFTRLQPAALPWVYGALVVGALCSLLSDVLIPDPSRERTLAASLGALESRLRQHLAACRNVVRGGAQAGELPGTAARLNEATLAACEQAGAFAEHSGAGELTSHLLEVELAARRLGAASRALPETERESAGRDLERLLHWTLAGRGGPLWPQEKTAEGSRETGALTPFAHALSAFASALTALRGFDLEGLEPRRDTAPPAPAPVLPGGMRLSTRQALQAALACALAIIGGELISPARWYWAVITAFIVFTGTSTRGELFVRAWQRVLGTLAGVVAGVLLATLLHGNVPLSLLLIFLSGFLGVYLIRLSSALMVFHITVMLALFYGLTGTFSPGLLELRLAETAFGALAGTLAAAFLLPTPTRGHLQRQTNAFFEALAAQFAELAAGARRGEVLRDSSRRALALSRHYGLLRVAAAPLSQTPFRGSWRQSLAFRLQLLRALEYETEGLLQLLRAVPAEPQDALAGALTSLQRRCEALSRGQVAPRQSASDTVLQPSPAPDDSPLAAQLARVGDRLGLLEEAAAAPSRSTRGEVAPA